MDASPRPAALAAEPAHPPARAQRRHAAPPRPVQALRCWVNGACSAADLSRWYLFPAAGRMATGHRLDAPMPLGCARSARGTGRQLRVVGSNGPFAEDPPQRLGDLIEVERLAHKLDRVGWSDAGAQGAEVRGRDHIASSVPLAPDR